jgi:DNA polymerase-3 subunit beta
VVPASFSRTVEVPTSVFLGKIETVSLVLSDSSSFIILRFEDNQLKLQASSTEVGEGSDMVEVVFEGVPFEVSFNPAFLADPLRNCDSETVRMKLNDPLNPVAIEGDEGFLYVIMPIRKK